MNIIRIVRDLAYAIAVASLLSAVSVGAQSAPPVRSIGPVLAVSTELLSSVSQVRSLPGGAVLVNDVLARRMVMFDSTLRRVGVVVDTQPQLVALIPYRGDSSLAVNPALLSMVVIDPEGREVRTMAIPDPQNLRGFLGGPTGFPGFDALGRLVYAALPPRPTRPPLKGARSLPDSAPIIRFDLNTRRRDTVATLRVPPARYAMRTVRVGKDTSSMLWRAYDPTPTTDDWAVLSDGTIAVVRGRDYHVDFIAETGGVSSGPKVPFDWERLSTEDRATIIDSTRKALLALETSILDAQAAARAKADSLTHRVAQPPMNIGVTVTYPLVTVDEMPDYRPAFEQGAARSDVDGHVWIRTSKFVAGGAVYDVINNRGMLIDRVAVPRGRTIAGFGAGGIVYMGVLLANGSARLEKARDR